MQQADRLSGLYRCIGIELTGMFLFFFLQISKIACCSMSCYISRAASLFGFSFQDFDPIGWSASDTNPPLGLLQQLTTHRSPVMRLGDTIHGLYESP